VEAFFLRRKAGKSPGHRGRVRQDPGIELRAKRQCCLSFLQPGQLICWTAVDTGRDLFRNLSGQAAGGDSVPIGVKGVGSIWSRTLWEQSRNQIVTQIAPPRWSKNSQNLLHQPAAPEPWVSARKGYMRLLGQSPGHGGGGVLSVLGPLFGSATSRPRLGGVGLVIRLVRLAQHGDSIACAAKQIQPGWRGHERSFPAEGAAASRLGRGGFGLLTHAGQVSTPKPRWQQSHAKRFRAS
jgi:hypothetical protein